jgi:hypothetical protein
MADTKIVQISGVAYPTRRMRGLATALHGPKFALSIDSMLEEAGAVNALAEAMEKSLEAALSKDGRVDMKNAAIHLIRLMRNNQK